MASPIIGSGAKVTMFIDSQPPVELHVRSWTINEGQPVEKPPIERIALQTWPKGFTFYRHLGGWRSPQAVLA